MHLYKRLRREYEHGLGTIRGVAQKYKVYRRTVRAALKNAVPLKRTVTPRERPKMALAIPFMPRSWVGRACRRGATFGYC